MTLLKIEKSSESVAQEIEKSRLIQEIYFLGFFLFLSSFDVNVHTLSTAGSPKKEKKEIYNANFFLQFLCSKLNPFFLYLFSCVAKYTFN